jgi:hypothetical protein
LGIFVVSILVVVWFGGVFWGLNSGPPTARQAVYHLSPQFDFEKEFYFLKSVMTLKNTERKYSENVLNNYIWAVRLWVFFFLLGGTVV